MFLRRVMLAAAAWLGTQAAAPGQVLLVGPNVDINRQTGYQAETAVAIDPTNTNRLFAWSNDLTGPRNSAAFSADGGLSWTARFTGADGFPALGGDPSCSFDPFGNLYASSLNSSFSNIQVGRSTNGGQSFAVIATIPGASLDQPTIKGGPGAVPGQESVWITYRTSGGVFAQGATSNGLGDTSAFGPALPVPGGGVGSFGDIAIGPDGRVAVAYQTPIGGAGPSTIRVGVNPAGGASFNTNGATVPTNVGGFRTIPAQPTRSVDAEVGLAYDLSAGPHRGRLYMVYTDAPSTTSNDLNVFVRFSDNDGASWSSPVRVNDDTGTNSQFFSKIAVDPTTGNVAVVWYDARNSPANNRVELWGSASVDGGQTFLPNAKISAGSTSGVGLGSGNELGDYLGLDYYGGLIYPVWADDSNSTGNNPNGTSNLDYYGAQVMLSPVPEPAGLATLGLAAGAGLYLRRRRGRPAVA